MVSHSLIIAIGVGMDYYNCRNDSKLCSGNNLPNFCGSNNCSISPRIHLVLCVRAIRGGNWWNCEGRFQQGNEGGFKTTHAFFNFIPEQTFGIFLTYVVRQLAMICMVLFSTVDMYDNLYEHICYSSVFGWVLCNVTFHLGYIAWCQSLTAILFLVFIFLIDKCKIL